ncbi:VOC family protein [Novosphingobium sp. fls2-241-R2A-195]|uniref:VOC family protein n=1 Tax=Novosphingobium sp. fls2-241-R2A-195 TaxID=3040296 RepID=UPI00254F1ED5|nr:VOC family protein [Novosphingobium sp. fls2-241-R2A-195]
MVAPGVPGSHVMQVAFMVEDLEAACMDWVRTTGIGPFLTVPHVVLEEYSYCGRPASGLDFSVAIAQSGGVQIELIQQHCDNPSAYRDTVAKGQGGFHHLAIYTDDYDAMHARYTQQGFVTAVDGSFGGFRFSYIDTSATLGCMIELIEENPLQGEFFARIAGAAQGWDGSDPIRPGFPVAAQ